MTPEEIAAIKARFDAYTSAFENIDTAGAEWGEEVACTAIDCTQDVPKLLDEVERPVHIVPAPVVPGVETEALCGHRWTPVADPDASLPACQACARALLAAYDYRSAQAQRLGQQAAADHKGFIESRRSIIAQRDAAWTAIATIRDWATTNHGGVKTPAEIWPGLADALAAAGEPAAPDPITGLAIACAAISRTVTASYPPGMDDELVMRRRVGKIFVEAGELGDAIEGYTGENPRKGHYATADDVLKELIDCASASLCAIEYMTGDEGRSLGLVAAQVAGNWERLSAALNAEQCKDWDASGRGEANR